jgi:RNA polymerase sigma-70 factor, ECF subfamily
MTMADAFESELLNILPRLRSMAMALTRDRTRAEDLLQDSLVRALVGKHSFQMGTNLTAWMYRLMRNRLFSLHRKQHAPMVSLDEPITIAVGANGNQDDHMAWRELERAIALLPKCQQAALLLVGAGYSYGEAAQAIGCAVGTIKSRICRARSMLRGRLQAEEWHPVKDVSVVGAFS